MKTEILHEEWNTVKGKIAVFIMSFSGDKPCLTQCLRGIEQQQKKGYNIEVFKIAIENNIPVIDITTSFLEQKNYSDYLCDDGIHPNEKGHELIAEAIMQHVARKNIEFDRAI